MMPLDDFDYDLPEHFIAQEPVEPRDSARLMVMDKRTGDLQHKTFSDIQDELRAGDLLVLNNTRVIPARLHARRVDTGGIAEFLLLRQQDDLTWQALIGGKRGNKGEVYQIIDTKLTCEIVDVLADAERMIRFSIPINDYLSQIGQIPLPPYIQTRLDDPGRYQTVYSQHDGSVAAPTAGLHFTPELLITLRERGIRFAYCTLHIGLGTFQPVKASIVQDHIMHHEYAVLNADNAHLINQTKLADGRIIAVGTTSARTLETAALLSAGGDPAMPYQKLDQCAWRPVIAFARDTNLFIYPGYEWRIVDGLITNFHLPRSTLLMMISSLAGRDNILKAYEVAKESSYRFFSFGDAMFIR